MKLRYFLIGLLSLPAAAQTTRTVQDLQLWPEAQAELALPGSDYLLLAARGERSTSAGVSRALGFDERRLTLGYEHFWNERWSGGATVRYIAYGGSHDYVLPELLLRHRSPIGPLTFGQRLSLERSFPVERLSGSGKAEGQTWVRLRLDLEKQLPLGRISLRPRLSYEAATHLRLQKAETDPNERFIQFTSARVELGCQLFEQFDLTPWFAYRTNYFITEPQYKEVNGVLVQTSGGKLNAVAPTLGLELRYTFLNGRKGSERQQLPTQH
ncbi:hypothetical protein GCM10023185_04890 [Hymenobacter saemangeumensis]|uniref:DUF2490 domain-containing protein n=1 Tax=Hymenobacter saemangeumensis TaxID=1084522 RepID=A0ABP8I0R7_9BACT